MWVIDQTTMLSETPVSVKTALDDMKNSVPPLELLKSRLDGDWAGQTVKPPLPWSAPVVSNWVTWILAAPRASSDLSKA